MSPFQNYASKHNINVKCNINAHDGRLNKIEAKILAV